MEVDQLIEVDETDRIDGGKKKSSRNESKNDNDATVTLRSDWDDRSRDSVKDMDELESTEDDVKRYYVVDAETMEVEDYLNDTFQSDNLSRISDDECEFKGFDEPPIKKLKRVHEKFIKESIPKHSKAESKIKSKKKDATVNEIKKELNTSNDEVDTGNDESDNVEMDSEKVGNSTLQQNDDGIEMKENEEKKVESNETESTASDQQSITIASRMEMYHKPLKMGWKREIVHRANPSSSRDKGEAYYITPSGKKLRTKGEIMQYLSPESGLSIENFTFTRDPLGFGPDEEIVRSAKVTKTNDLSSTPRRRSIYDNNNLGKRVPKPKAPKGASPPPQGWTPSKAVKSVTSMSPRSVSQVKNSDEGSESKNSKSVSKSSSKPTKKGEPCTIQCVLAMGTIPQLQCVKCLCLFHHKCVIGGVDHKNDDDEGGTLKKMKIDNGSSQTTSFDGFGFSTIDGSYICESCRNDAMKTTSPPPTSAQQQFQSSNTKLLDALQFRSSQSQSSMVGNLSQATEQNVQKTTLESSTTQATTTISSVLSTTTSTTSSTSTKTVAKPVSASRRPPSQPPITESSHDNNNGNSTNSNNGNDSVKNSNIEMSLSLPQSIAVIKGRKYVVIRKLSIPSSSSSSRHNSTDKNPNSGIMIGDEPTQTDSSKSISSRHKSSDSATSTTQQQSGGGALQRASYENFTTNYFGNVSMGYDILLHTFQYLKVQELMKAACVCRLWNVVANHRSLWKTVRMKNSQITNWTGLSRILQRNETKHLDLRKMLNTNDDEMWTSFLNNIKNVTSLRAIDLCRCSSKIVENLFLTNPNLKILNANAIKDDALCLDDLKYLKDLQELRLKSIDSCTIQSSLSSFKFLKNLKHLSLTSFRELGQKQIDHLGELTELETLELGDCTEFNMDFVNDVLPKLQKLERLRLEKGLEPCCTLDILEAISKLPNLTQLELVNFDVRTGFNEKLSKCTNLEKLLLIPTYVSQSATTNNIVLKALLNLSQSLRSLTWVVTLELLRVTALYVVQCDEKKKDNKVFDESIPVLKPVPNSTNITINNDENNENITKSQKSETDVPQVEILPLAKVEKILSQGMPDTKFKILKVPYHSTWRQNLIETQ